MKFTRNDSTIEIFPDDFCAGFIAGNGFRLFMTGEATVVDKHRQAVVYPFLLTEMNGNPSIILYIVDINYPSVLTVMLARAENTRDDIFFGTDTAHDSFLAMKRNLDYNKPFISVSNREHQRRHFLRNRHS